MDVVPVPLRAAVGLRREPLAVHGLHVAAGPAVAVALLHALFVSGVTKCPLVPTKKNRESAEI